MEGGRLVRRMIGYVGKVWKLGWSSWDCERAFAEKLAKAYVEEVELVCCTAY